MNVLTTITPNFQVHIPIAIRKKSGITSHGKAIIRAEKGKIIIEKQEKGFLDLGGTFRPKKAINVENLRDYVDLSE